ncbi:hypothetical protein ILUMI_04598 [Ignelater luminosus]|uniref:Transmembrane protein 70 homolog, mitochondrial n=1 Tax=Ignelater luminosus TaxID=2038154 RepID=A0A8K0DJF2_IGNLU|nr:hypothetical protein ILUMI_04598 [Ignelater luminosus]
MSVRTCFRLIPTILKHTNCKQVFLLQNYNSLLKCNQYVVPSSLSHCTLRFASTNTTKSIPTDTDKDIQVYYGILTPQMRAVKLFSLLTSFTGIAAQPFIYKQIGSIDNIPLIIGICSFVGFFTLVTPFLLHFITKKYVTRLVYKPETKTYVATTLTLLNMSKEIEFTPEDVRIPEVPGMFTSFEAKGNPLFLDPRLFEDPTHYGKIMGYDKPLDLKLFQTSLNEKKKSS